MITSDQAAMIPCSTATKFAIPDIQTIAVTAYSEYDIPCSKKIAMRIRILNSGSRFEGQGNNHTPYSAGFHCMYESPQGKHR